MGTKTPAVAEASGVESPGVAVRTPPLMLDFKTLVGPEAEPEEEDPSDNHPREDADVAWRRIWNPPAEVTWPRKLAGGVIWRAIQDSRSSVMSRKRTSARLFLKGELGLTQFWCRIAEWDLSKLVEWALGQNWEENVRH